MNKILTTIVCCCFMLPIFAQDSVKLKILSETEQYDEMIKYAAKPEELSAPALYYVGLAYYMKQQDSACLKFMDIAIEKNDKDPRPYFIKGNTLNYGGRYNEAIPCFNKAISLYSEDAKFYSSLGDSYYQLKNYEMALQAFNKASTLPEPPDHALIMIPQVYIDMSQQDSALAANYHVKDKVSKESGAYSQVLYNIGLLEMLNDRHDKAEPFFQELVTLDPSDYMPYAKLIQIYYHGKEYDKAKPYRDKLYEAYKKGALNDNMKDMFCIDQFKFDDKRIQVFERYEEGKKDKIYNKLLFYMVNKGDSVEMRLQTEFSPISIELGGAKYILCATKDGAHINYGIGFNDDSPYEDIKETVIRVLEKKYKPVAVLR